MNIVSNTGPMIALAKVDHLDLLNKLFGQVYIPMWWVCLSEQSLKILSHHFVRFWNKCVTKDIGSQMV